MWEHITPQGVSAIVGALVVLQGVNIWVTSALIDKKLIALNGLYVRSTECALRSGSNREMINLDRVDMRSACGAAVLRDEITQRRIDDLVKAITARATETILRDQEILSKINELLLR